MVPSDFLGYFAASAGAGAALVGLLFVAISIEPEAMVQEGAPVERRTVAGGAFNALLNAMFISLSALLPRLNLGVVALTMGIISLINSLFIGGHLLKEQIGWKNTFRGIWMVLIGLLLYGTEVVYAVRLLVSPSNTDTIFNMGFLLMGIYALGLIRAWELIGARRYGLFGWLNPLYDVRSPATNQQDEKPAIVRADASASPRR